MNPLDLCTHTLTYVGPPEYGTVILPQHPGRGVDVVVDGLPHRVPVAGVRPIHILNHVLFNFNIFDTTQCSTLKSLLFAGQPVVIMVSLRVVLHLKQF